MNFCKIRDVKSPTRANKTDAGIDFYVPEYSEEYSDILALKNVNKKEIDVDKHFKNIVIKPGGNLLIPAGVKTILKPRYALIAFNKSGVASKQDLIIGACVVDEEEVLTDKGYIKVKDLKDYNDIKVASYNQENKTVEFKSFDGFRKTRNSPTIKLKFDNGKTLVCSEDHFIMTTKGYKMVKDITIEDEILSV